MKKQPKPQREELLAALTAYRTQDGIDPLAWLDTRTRARTPNDPLHDAIKNLTRRTQ